MQLDDDVFAQSSTSPAEAERYIRDSESQWAEAVASGDIAANRKLATAARFALTCGVAGKNYVGQFSVRCAVLWPSSKSFDLVKQRTRLVERQEVTSVFNGYGCCL